MNVKSQCGDDKCSQSENFHIDVIGAFHVHIMVCYDRIDTFSCKFSLHALANDRENPNPCHVLLLKIQTWGVVETAISHEAR